MTQIIVPALSSTIIYGMTCTFDLFQIDDSSKRLRCSELSGRGLSDGCVVIFLPSLELIPIAHGGLWLEISMEYGIISNCNSGLSFSPTLIPASPLLSPSATTLL